LAQSSRGFRKGQKSISTGSGNHCTDGTAFKAFRILPRKSCIIIEVYGKPGEKTKIRFVPYEHIKYIDLKEESEDLQFQAKPPLGFRMQKSKED
jgi:hypothetical protein